MNRQGTGGKKTNLPTWELGIGLPFSFSPYCSLQYEAALRHAGKELVSKQTFTWAVPDQLCTKPGIYVNRVWHKSALGTR